MLHSLLHPWHRDNSRIPAQTDSQGSYDRQHWTSIETLLCSSIMLWEATLVGNSAGKSVY